MTSLIDQHARRTNADFLIYTTSFCPYCTAATRFLEEVGMTWEEVNLDTDHEMLNEIKRITEHRTVPIILDVRKETPLFIGGFDQLRPYLS
ncbi:MAG TPA: glutaredoxin [Candidatus Poseidoniales archaeon]|nr:glutaredoxin [Candidatus Poseidoniales archaeon]